MQIDIIPQGYIFGKNVCFWSSYPLLNELCRCKRSSVFCARLRLRIFCFKRFSILDRTPKLHEPVQYSSFCFKAKFKNNFKTYEPILQNLVFIHERVSHKGEVRPEERLKNEFRRQKNETETQKRIVIAAMHDNGVRCCRRRRRGLCRRVGCVQRQVKRGNDLFKRRLRIHPQPVQQGHAYKVHRQKDKHYFDPDND